MKQRFEKWVHVKITDAKLAEKLDVMSVSDQRDRSKFIRWLIQQEWIRRNSRGYLDDSLLIQNTQKIMPS